MPALSWQELLEVLVYETHLDSRPGYGYQAEGSCMQIMEGETMWCVKCKKHISECTCEDLEERLNSAVGGGHFAYRYCKVCGKHYERCQCEKPEWGVKGKD